MTSQTEVSQRNHHRAVRFFWALLIGATVVSLLGNVTHVVLAYLPRLVVQIGAAAVPPLVLLVAVHGIALAVRAGASGWVYRSAVGAVAAIGTGAFALSFMALQDLMLAIGYSPRTAWIFPVLIDTTLAVCTLMIVALGDKPARPVPRIGTQGSTTKRLTETGVQAAKTLARRQGRAPLANAAQAKGGDLSSSREREPVRSLEESAQVDATQSDRDLASELIALGTTTQPVDTVVAVLVAVRNGASINAAAKAAGINYRTAQRIVQASGQPGRLAAAS